MTQTRTSRFFAQTLLKLRRHNVAEGHPGITNLCANHVEAAGDGAELGLDRGVLDDLDSSSCCASAETNDIKFVLPVP